MFIGLGFLLFPFFSNILNLLSFQSFIGSYSFFVSFSFSEVSIERNGFVGDHDGLFWGDF